MELEIMKKDEIFKEKKNELALDDLIVTNKKETQYIYPFIPHDIRNQQHSKQKEGAIQMKLNSMVQMGQLKLKRVSLLTSRFMLENHECLENGP